MVKRYSARRNALEKLDVQMQCFELRKTGMSYDEIAEELGIDAGKAYSYVLTVVKDRQSRIEYFAQEQRELIIGRIESLISTLWDDASEGNLYSVDRIIRLNEQAISVSGAKVDKVDVTSNGKSLGEVTGETIKNVMEQAAKELADFEEKKRLDSGSS